MKYVLIKENKESGTGIVEEYVNCTATVALFYIAVPYYGAYKSPNKNAITREVIWDESMKKVIRTFTSYRSLVSYLSAEWKETLA